jgi:hypothetical protein
VWEVWWDRGSREIWGKCDDKLLVLHFLFAHTGSNHQEDPLLSEDKTETSNAQQQDEGVQQPSNQNGGLCSEHGGNTQDRGEEGEEAKSRARSSSEHDLSEWMLAPVHGTTRVRLSAAMKERIARAQEQHVHSLKGGEGRPEQEAGAVHAQAGRALSVAGAQRAHTKQDYREPTPNFAQVSLRPSEERTASLFVSPYDGGGGVGMTSTRFTTMPQGGKISLTREGAAMFLRTR